MPSADRHREWAKRNRDVYDHIGGAASYWGDWAITLLFYSAVHEISAFLTEHVSDLQAAGFQAPTNHKERKLILRTLWPSLAMLYEPLEQRSWGARYHCRVFAETEIKLGEGLLKKLQAEIKSLG